MFDEIGVVYMAVTKKAKSVSMKPEAMKRQGRLVAEGKCLGCECVLDASRKPTRGLCQSCYNAAMYQISKEAISMEGLVRAGRILVQNSGRRQKVKWVKEIA